MTNLDDIRARVAVATEDLEPREVSADEFAAKLAARFAARNTLIKKDVPHLLTLLAERDAQIAAVRGLHVPRDQDACGEGCCSARVACEQCDRTHPCPTIKALDPTDEALVEFAEWLVSLDDPDPESRGFQDRCTVTLTRIIELAREALDAKGGAS